MINSYGDFLRLFPERPRRKAGDGCLVLCPAHNDHEPSLLVRPSKNADFVATWDCQAGKCKREDVLKALKLGWRDVCRHGRGDSNDGDGCQSVNLTAKHVRNKVDPLGTDAVNGVTLVTLAEPRISL